MKNNRVFIRELHKGRIHRPRLSHLGPFFGGVMPALRACFVEWRCGHVLTLYHDVVYNSSMPTKVHTTLNDVWHVLAMCATDSDVVRELERLHPSRRIIAKAVAALRARGRSPLALERYANAQGWRVLKQRGGRSAPRVGETRVYTAIKSARGGCMVRVPLDSLSVAAGRPVNVCFEGTRIVIEPGAVATA